MLVAEYHILLSVDYSRCSDVSELWRNVTQHMLLMEGTWHCETSHTLERLKRNSKESRCKINGFSRPFSYFSRFLRYLHPSTHTAERTQPESSHQQYRYHPESIDTYAGGRPAEEVPKICALIAIFEIQCWCTGHNVELLGQATVVYECLQR